MPTPAGLLRRLAALCYDSVLVAAILFVATAILVAFRGGIALEAHNTGYFFYLFVTIFAFYGWFWTHGGQTLGMRAWKIRLYADDSKPVTWYQVAIRYVIACVSIACFGVGYLWILVDTHKRAWHDIVSHTKVVVVDHT